MQQSDMYPTDIIFSLLFNFTEKESPIEHFEVLGYEGSNFVPLTGSAFINIGLAVLTVIMVRVGQAICRRLYKYEAMRKLGPNSSQRVFQQPSSIFTCKVFLR